MSATQDPATIRLLVVSAIATITFNSILKRKVSLLEIVSSFINALALVYLSLIFFLLILGPMTGIQSLHYFFPEMSGGIEGLSKIVEQKSLISFDHLDCSITSTTINRQIFSIWFYAHVVGWWAKMTMFRDWKICWIYSFMFEVTELSLVWIIPEFQECWWDSLFIDIFGANFFGMILGRLTINLFNLVPFNWNPYENNKVLKQEVQSISVNKKIIFSLISLPISSTTGNVLSSCQFPSHPNNNQSSLSTNISIDQCDQIKRENIGDRWGWTKFFLLSCIPWIFSLIIELNSFFLIHSLLLRPSHWINPGRQLLLGGIGFQGTIEWYNYVRSSTSSIKNIILLLLITIVEFLICFTYGRGGVTHIPSSNPSYIFSTLFIFAVMSICWIFLDWLGKGSYFSKMLIYLSPLPLFILSSGWKY